MRLAGWTYSYEKVPIEESLAHMATVGFDGSTIEYQSGEVISASGGI